MYSDNIQVSLLFMLLECQFWILIIVHPTSRRACFRPGRTGHYERTSSHPHRNLMGPYLAFVVSTINGYECMDRSLSTTTLWSSCPSVAKESAPARTNRTDFQLMSDALPHLLFVLPPIKDGETLVVLQVALEGNISKSKIMVGLSRGARIGDGSKRREVRVGSVWLLFRLSH